MICLSFTAIDVSNPYQVCLWLAKNKSFSGVKTLVNSNLVLITPDIIDAAKKSGHKEMMMFLEQTASQPDKQHTVSMKKK